MYRDKNFIKLKNNLINHNKYIEEAKISFKNSPFNDSKAFKSVVLIPENTKFETKNTKQLSLILSFIIGGIIGIFYVLIKNIYRNN